MITNLVHNFEYFYSKDIKKFDIISMNLIISNKIWLKCSIISFDEKKYEIIFLYITLNYSRKNIIILISMNFFSWFIWRYLNIILI